MNWEALGAIGEIIGAAAVLATLFYLAAQIKMQNRQLEKSNDHARAQTSVQINDQALEFVDILMRDKEFVEIYRKGLSNQPLNENEVVQFSYFIVRMAGLLESNVTAAKAGVSFEGDYDVEFLYGNPFMHKLINTDVGERWFKEIGKIAEKQQKPWNKATKVSNHYNIENSFGSYKRSILKFTKISSEFTRQPRLILVQFHYWINSSPRLF
jgi:hypothetical protein